MSLIAAMLAVAVPARATRFEFIARSAGTAVPGARVCFIPAVEHPSLVSRTSSAESRCFSADQIIEVPTGVWHFFAVKDELLVSFHPFRIQVPEGEDAGILHSVDVELLPAAVLEFTAAPPVKSGEFRAVYLSNETQPLSPAAIRPVGKDGRLVVPAGMTVVPLVMAQGRILDIGPEVVPRAGETVRIAPLRALPVGVRNIAVHVLAADVKTAAGDAPAVRLLQGGKKVAEATLRATPLFHDSLVFFRGVPDAASVVELSGAGWVTLPQTVASAPADRNVTLVSLRVSNAAVLSVEWTIDSAFREQPSAVCEAAAKVEVPGRPATLRLQKCTADQAALLQRGRKAACELVFEKKLPEGKAAGTELVTALPAGEYVAELRTGAFSALQPVTWQARENVTERLTLSPKFVSGRVTRNGAAVGATLTFPNGSAVTDPATGAYRMLLTRPLDRITLVSVIPCDSGLPYVHRTAAPVLAGTVHDIDIPSAGLAVTVTNSVTGKPVANAIVSVAEDEVEYPLYELEPLRADEHGKAKFAPVLRDTPLRVCAGGADFSRSCRGGVRVGDETVEVRLKLDPKNALVRGKIVSRAPVQGGRVYLVHNRIVANSASVGADQRFTFDSVPAETTLVLTDQVHGLVVLGPPAFDAEGTLVAPVPDLSPISFSVLVAEGVRSEASHLTLQVGNVLLPRTVFMTHQSNTGSQSLVVPGLPLPVTRVVPTGPVHVVLGFPYASIPGLDGDMFARPDLVATMPAKQVTGPVVGFD